MPKKRLPLPPTEECEAALRRRGWNEDDDGCWIVNAKTNRDGGYGLIRIGGRQGQCYVSSRLAYVAWVGPLSPEEDVLHSCDNPPCINPAHLSVGDMQQNQDDMWSKGRRATTYSLEDARRVRGLRSEGHTYTRIQELTGVNRSHAHRMVTHSTCWPERRDAEA